MSASPSRTSIARSSSIGTCSAVRSSAWPTHHRSACEPSSASRARHRAARSVGFAYPAAPRWRVSRSSRNSRRWRFRGTHISFNVRNTQKWYDYLVSKGVECVSRPERSPRGHTFFFARDFDGNSIEMIDLGPMYPVLKWLGPLGGMLFRRGRYKEYYWAPSATR
jgi:catechol 2,3-dioxygenase-like lactoylglutathione lyase family enzyme